MTRKVLSTTTATMKVIKGYLHVLSVILQPVCLLWGHELLCQLWFLDGKEVLRVHAGSIWTHLEAGVDSAAMLINVVSIIVRWSRTGLVRAVTVNTWSELDDMGSAASMWMIVVYLRRQLVCAGANSIRFLSQNSLLNTLLEEAKSLLKEGLNQGGTSRRGLGIRFNLWFYSLILFYLHGSKRIPYYVLLSWLQAKLQIDVKFKEAFMPPWGGKIPPQGEPYFRRDFKEGF